VWRGGTLHRGPDLDIRSCRLHSDRGRDLLSLHCSLTGHIVIPPFRYPPGCPQAALWRHRSDQFLLDRCSTTPAAESARFLPALRAALARLESDPEPEVSLFPGGTPRRYARAVGRLGPGSQWVLLPPPNTQYSTAPDTKLPLG